jgi:hypothetical protein
MEPLIFKIETQADDSGVRKYEKSLDGVNISSRKASGALKSFVQDIAQARDGTDVASAALGAFSRVLGSSLAGTGIIIAGKALIDAFSKIDEAVTQSEKAVSEAFVNMEKAGKAMSFAEAVGQAKNFEGVAENIRKKIKEINDSPFTSIIDNITQSTKLMDIQATIAENQSREIKRVGAESELTHLKRMQGLDAENKALELNARSLEKELGGIDAIKESETALAVTRKYQMQADEIRAKYAEERSVKEREASDTSRKNIMEEFQLEIDSQNRKTESESKAFFDKLDRQKQLLEQSKKIEESESKLNDLLNKRIEIEDQLQKARQGETIRQGELATMSAGAGGSLRGAGQRRTSLEIGLEKSANRAYQNEINRQAARVDEEIAFDLYLQRGAGSRVGKSDIQNEKVRRAEQSKAEQAKLQFEDPYRKQIDKTTQILKDNEKQISTQSNVLNEAMMGASDFAKVIGEASGNIVDSFLKPGKTPSAAGAGADGGRRDTASLSSIQELLQKNFDELKAYAHAT